MRTLSLVGLCVLLVAPAFSQFQGFNQNSFSQSSGFNTFGQAGAGQAGGFGNFNSQAGFGSGNQGGGRPQGGRPQGGGGRRRGPGRQRGQRPIGPDGEEIEPFDINKDVAPVRVAQEMGDAVRAAVSPFASDASLVVRITTLMANSFFDAIAPYHPTAVGIYSNLGRRPAHERTNRNKNIAVFYCSARVLGNAIPDQALRFSDLLEEVGLDPSDTHESSTDPIGIGNTCGRMINEVRDNDGMNSKGDIGAKSPYNHKPFNDYTGYKPVNTYDKINDPRRWQPAVVDQNGVFKIQKYVTPQHGNTLPYSYSDVNQFQAKPHGRLLEGPNGKDLYKKTTDEVLAIQAALTDEQKMAAEFFDDKLLSIGYATFGTYEVRNLTYDEFVFLEAFTNIAAFDATIAIWKEKSRWDAVRPFTAIPYLYGDSPITSYCGKGQGTCRDLPASDWASYMPVADHPEYPSTTAAICAAHAEASRNWYGSDQTLLDPVPFIQGNSRREFGLTPRRNTSLNIGTWTDFELTCGSSRLWGGVHFVDAVEEGNRIGNEIGKLAYEFVMRHVYPDGTEPQAERLAGATPANTQAASAPLQVAPTGPALVQGLPPRVGPVAHHTTPQYPSPYYYPQVHTPAPYTHFAGKK